MKTFIIIIVSFALGLAAGFSLSLDRSFKKFLHIQKLFEELLDNDIEDYMRLKNQEEKFAKAEEIMGKAMLIFLADLELKLSEDKIAFAKRVTSQKPTVSVTPAPIPTTELPTRPSPEPSMPTKQPITDERQGSAGIPSVPPQLVPGVSGNVSFAGASQLTNIKMNSDPGCLKANGGKDSVDAAVLVGQNHGLANVLVYVKEGVAPEANTSQLPPVVFDQRNCMYHPRVFGIVVGQTLKIQNSDPFLHNIHAMTKNGPGFNNGMATKGASIEKKFTKPELSVRVKCDVHGWMLAWAHVLENHYFAVTDESGNFHIDGLPAGDYVLETVHEKLGSKTRRLRVRNMDQPSWVEFKY